MLALASTPGPADHLTGWTERGSRLDNHRGDTAPEAAGVIHTDFQKGFIKARSELPGFGSCGLMADAKAAGKVRMEGKDYVMTDGDVVEFRFNV